jgi:hypothetical protein
MKDIDREYSEEFDRLRKSGEVIGNIYDNPELIIGGDAE